MTISNTKKLNTLWAKSTNLQNPFRERHMFDLAFFLWSNRQFEESVAVSATLIEQLADRPGESLWIDAMHLQSMALHDLKRDGEAIESELRSLEYAETLEPASERAFMHWHLADCYRTTEQPEKQEVQYIKAIDAFIDSENKFFLGQAYIDLANLYFGARRYDLSRHGFKLAIQVLEETSRTDCIPFVKYRLAGIERYLGNPQGALKIAEEAVALSKFLGDLVNERESLIEIAQIQTQFGNVDCALNILDSLVEDNNEAKKNRTAAKALYFKAKTLSISGRFSEALKFFEISAAVLKAVGEKVLATNAELSIIHLRYPASGFNSASL